MSRFIINLADELFKNIPFSNASENARHKIEQTLCEEYDKESENNDNIIDVMSNVLKKYNTFDKAGEFKIEPYRLMDIVK